MNDSSSLCRFPRGVGLLLVAAAFFAAYCQAPLYYSNQNQYFLHGLADAGYGLLRDDWLANTHDPTPVFTALVTFTARYLHPWLFHVWYAVLLGAYVMAMMGLFAFLAGESAASRRWPVFAALLVAVHSGLARWCSYRWFGDDYPWFLQDGLAGQYILGACLQPSAFGALLVVAVYLFVKGWAMTAIVYTVLTATIHPSYLLPAALLTGGFLTAMCLENRWRAAVKLGGLALVLVAPTVLFVLLLYQPTSPEVFAEAQNILVNFRIPHHSQVDRWLDGVAMLQIAWMILALALVWRTRLFPVLVVPFALATLLTLIQAATHSTSLALLFPWRMSSVLVPIATTIVLSRLVTIPALPLDGRIARATSVAVLLFLACAGICITAGHHAFLLGDEDLAVMDFVKRTARKGDIYFLPVRVPETKPGAFSSDFKPLSEKRRDERVIEMDLQRFRLHAEAPIFVDFKAIPYRDVEVVEWRKRIRMAEAIQEQLRSGRITDVCAVLRSNGITHLVLPAGTLNEQAGLACEYHDAHYQVCRLIDP